MRERERERERERARYPGPPHRRAGPCVPHPSAPSSSTGARPHCRDGPQPTSPSGPSVQPAPSYRASWVRPNFSFRDVVLTQPRSPPLLPRPPFSPAPVLDHSLPAASPRFLLNRSLFGRCFRCFLKGHRAAACRGPKRCLLCISPSHPASRRRAPSSSRPMASGLIEGHPSLMSAYLPTKHQPKGPSLSGRVARVDSDVSLDCIREVLPKGLASMFGVSASLLGGLFWCFLDCDFLPKLGVQRDRDRAQPSEL